MSAKPRLGATVLGDGQCAFTVWAPEVEQVAVQISSPIDIRVPMTRDSQGYHHAVASGVGIGSRYGYVLGDAERPDPASRSQPDGVHRPSEVVDPAAFAWTDGGWFGLPLDAYVIYELHVGTFTPAGTFDAIIPRLPELRDLGVTAIELMPIAQFPGGRNWGYDGVYPFAAQSTYGGLGGLQRLVDASHAAGLAIILDVVYNHLGPEGNYLSQFGPYFTQRYQTPWGSAVNFDGPASDDVRHYFIENALYWLTECHLDALRLDAVHTIMDTSAYPFLEELADGTRERAERENRRLALIAESDANDPRVILPPHLGGYGLDAQWADDLHHSIHALLTGERSGYYEDFGSVEHVAQALKEGYAYTGQYAPHRRRRHGRRAPLTSARQYVVASQTHDQVGNRKDGDRLSTLVSFESLKLAAATVLLSPFIPLLFMGEEYAEPAPFQYFTSHSDAGLIEAVRNGRRAEFAAFGWQGDVPDPHAEETFKRSTLHWELRNEGEHRALWELYQELLRLRRKLLPLAHLSKDDLAVTCHAGDVLQIRRWWASEEILIGLCFGEADVRVPVTSMALNPFLSTESTSAVWWRKVLDTADERWMGPGSVGPDELGRGPGENHLVIRARSAVIYRRIERQGVAT